MEAKSGRRDQLTLLLLNQKLVLVLLLLNQHPPVVLIHVLVLNQHPPLVLLLHPLMLCIPHLHQLPPWCRSVPAHMHASDTFMLLLLLLLLLLLFLLLIRVSHTTPRVA